MKAIKIQSSWGGTSWLPFRIWKSQFCWAHKGEIVVKGRIAVILREDNTFWGVGEEQEEQRLGTGGRYCYHHQIWWWWEWTSPADLISEPSCWWMGLPFSVTLSSSPNKCPLAAVAEVPILSGRWKDQCGLGCSGKRNRASRPRACCPFDRQVFSTNRMAFPVPASPRELLADKLASQGPGTSQGGVLFLVAMVFPSRAEQAGHGAVSVFSDPVLFVWWTLMELMRLQWAEPAWAGWGWILWCARLAWCCLLEFSTGCSACFTENLSCTLASWCEGRVNIWRDKE